MKMLLRALKELNIGLEMQDLKALKYKDESIMDDINQLIKGNTYQYSAYNLRLRILDDDYTVDRYFHLTFNHNLILKLNALDVKSLYIMKNIVQIYELLVFKYHFSFGEQKFTIIFEEILSILTYYSEINYETDISSFQRIRCI